MKSYEFNTKNKIFEIKPKMCTCKEWESKQNSFRKDVMRMLELSSILVENLFVCICGKVTISKAFRTNSTILGKALTVLHSCIGDTRARKLLKCFSSSQSSMTAHLEGHGMKIMSIILSILYFYQSLSISKKNKIKNI